MKFLISTTVNNTEVIYVKLALEERGHKVRLIFPADLPLQQKNSIYLDDTKEEWSFLAPLESYKDESYDVVWWKSAQGPCLPQNIVESERYASLLAENNYFFESLYYNMASQARWINPREAARRAYSKLLQLRTASSLGLKVPISLFSNNPKDIRSFFLKYEEQGVRYKALAPGSELQAKDLIRAKLFAKEPCFSTLPTNQVLQASPGLFQQKLKKRSELRVLCFEDTLIAVKLNKPKRKEDECLPQSVLRRNTKVESYSLPVRIERIIRLFLRALGLVFASLNLIETMDGELVFIGLDEQGDFLWLEEQNSELHLLELFIQFLLAESGAFKWTEKQNLATLDGYRQEVGAIALKNACCRATGLLQSQKL